MSGFIKSFVYGNLTRDPEQRVTTAGLTITKFAVAVSRHYKGLDGTQKEEVTFIDVDAFGKPAELIAQHFTKGKPILFEGRLRQDTWETQTGERRSKHVMVLENFHFISPGRVEADSVHPSSIPVSPEINTQAEASIKTPLNIFKPPLPNAIAQRNKPPLAPVDLFDTDEVPF
jgi:single-strand DNA-binding protein